MHHHQLAAGAIVLALSASAAAAPAKKAPVKDDTPTFSAAANFTALGNSQYDRSFNQEVFTQMVVDALNRKGISTDPDKRGKNHLTFDVSYVYHVGDVEYRFVTYFLTVRNPAGQAVCDVRQAAWWGGPSGPAQVRNTFDSVAASFFKNCLT